MALDLSSLTSKEAVTAIFVGYYDRAPAPNGLNYWADELDAGAPLSEIARAFSVVPESQTKYPELGTTGSTDLAGNVAFVTAVFQNLFNRAPNNIDGDGSGNYWVQQLEAGADIGQLILDIMSGAQGSDREILTNKIEVGLAFSNAAEEAGALTRAEAGDAIDTILDGVNAGDASVDAALAQIAVLFPTDGGTGVANDPIFLSSGTDVLFGDENDDTFNAYIAQNPQAGGISNTLSSADRLDGGAGYDRLYAEIVNEFVGTGGIVSPDIQPRTTSIEEALFEARELFDSPLVGPGLGGILDGGGSGGQIVDAKWMMGVERIGSSFSDASLKIENLTTLASDGETIRNTEDITIVMRHTENTNSSQNELASDLTVLFDEDYLIAGQTSQGEAQFFLLDQDAELRLKDGNPSTTAEGRLDEIDKNGIRFQIGDDAPVAITFDEALLDELNSNEVNSHDAFVLALQADLNAKIAAGLVPAGTTITLEDNNNQIILDENGLALNRAALQDGSFSDLIPGIKVTSGNGAVVTPLGFVAPTELPGEFNVFGRFSNEFETTINPITINVDLEKAGRAGQGGDLIIGGKELTDGGEGIEVFNVNVIGNSSKPSWITNLNSTNDTLDTIIVTTDGAVAGSGDVADLTISEIGGASFNNGNDETDVRVFDATGFEGDFTGFANLDEFGNGAHSYLLGGGDDSLSITFGDSNGSDDNDVFGGAAGDSLTIDTGAGDDVLRLNSAAQSEGPATGGADLEFLEIETGAGDDAVFFNTDNDNGSTAGDGASISTSGGDDRVYMSDGASEFTALDITGIGDADNFQLFEGALQVTFAGVQSEWVDIDYNSSTYRTSREDIREAIVAAIQGSTALAGMIEIVELTDGTLQARSLVSGTSADISVDIEGPVASAAAVNATTNQLSDSVGGSDEPVGVADEAGWDLLNAQPTVNQINYAALQAAWSAWYPSSQGLADLSSGDAEDFFGNTAGPVGSVDAILTLMDGTADALDIDGALAGTAGNSSDDNVINGGANDDLIVLSTSAVTGGNGNTVEFTGAFGFDTIVNFTSDGAATTPPAVGDFSDNDILDFTSYLDAAADARAESVADQVLRVNEDVDYTFINVMAADSGATVIDHNQIRLMSFQEMWTELEGATPGSGPNNFDSLTAANVDAWLEANFSSTGDVIGGSATGGNGLGNNFLVLVGKDGDIEITPAAAEGFETDHADNQFWAFEATVSAYRATATTDGNYDFDVTFLGGVDLAETNVTGLTADDFGVTLFT